MNATTTQSRWTCTRWLIWKETCQLVPLMASLFLIVGILWAIQSSMSQVRTDGYYSQLEWTFLILPIVFATGAGAIMVGVEREQGTLQWMSMLPLTRRRLILTKFGVAVVGLGLAWTLAALLMNSFGVDRTLGSRMTLDDASVQRQGVHLVAWFARSIFILTVSFYTAWKIANPFLSLVVLLALMFVPSLIVWMLLGAPKVEVWIGQTREIQLTLAAVLASTCWFAYAGYRSAITTLSAAPADSWHPGDVLRWIGSNISGKRAYHFESPLAALLWHSLRNMAWVWVSNGVLIAFVLVCLYFNNDLRLQGYQFLTLNQDLDLPKILFGLAASWLGVSVFQFGGAAESVRPLALIGVSPTRVYIARHAVPVAMLSAGIVGYAFIATLLAQNSMNIRRESTLGLPSVLVVGLGLGIVYTISQWISQCFRTAILAYLVAPLVSLSVARWMTTGPVGAPSSITMLVACMIVLMAVTWSFMRRYMMGNERPRSVVTAVLVSFFFYFGVMRPPVDWPSMFGEVRRVDFETASVSNSANGLIQINSKMQSWLGESDETDAGTKERQREFLRTKLNDDYTTSISLFENMAELHARPEAVAQMDLITFGQLFRALMFERMVYRANRDERFYGTLRDVANLVAGLRRSDRWLDQESADRLEVYLADTLHDEDLGLDRSTAELVAAVEALPSIATRNESRRRAILASYSEFENLASVSSETLIGGLLLDNKQQSLAAVTGRSNRRERMAAIIQASLDAVDSDSQPGKIQSWQIAMHEQTVYAAVPLEWGPYSDWHRNQLPTIATIPPGFFGDSLYPVRYVGLPWEKQIERSRGSAAPFRGQP